MNGFMIPLALSILAHVTDFLFQTDNTAKEKKRATGKRLPETLDRCFLDAFSLDDALRTHGCASVLCGPSLFHILLDVFKSSIESKRGPATRFSMFIIDQLLHLMLIVFSCSDFQFYDSQKLFCLYSLDRFSYRTGFSRTSG